MDYQLRMSKDEHGQPIRQTKLLRENNISKAFDQLSGICNGILADGIVNQAEAEFFCKWMANHEDLKSEWPFSDLLDRIQRIYSDGIITVDEQEELRDVMQAIIGQGYNTLESAALSTGLPLNKNIPTPFLFTNKQFTLTGKFALGTRKVVADLIQTKGGVVSDGFPSKATDYLVIGVFASRDWQFTNYGRKIERAIALREQNNTLVILSEHHLKKALT